MRKVARLVTAALVCATALLPLSGCTACSAVGYIYSGPAVVELDGSLPADLTVSACFGEGCVPAALTHTEGLRWAVPQESPYVAELSVPGEERTLRVLFVNEAGGVLSDAEHEIPITSEPTGVFGQCSGPFSFEPVVVSLP